MGRYRNAGTGVVVNNADGAPAPGPGWVSVDDVAPRKANLAGQADEDAPAEKKATKKAPARRRSTKSADDDK